MLMEEQLIERFYGAFSAGKVEEMAACYADAVEFEDPAFGKLNGAEAKAMWRMLLERSKGDLTVKFGDIHKEGDRILAKWEAVYFFGPSRRKVINKIQAEFRVRDGKIVWHRDSFDLWKWSRMALGWKGWLLGWTPLMRKKIQAQSRGLLKRYMAG
jgi:ketosteroid isomerase-like protein